MDPETRTEDLNGKEERRLCTNAHENASEQGFNSMLYYRRRHDQSTVYLTVCRACLLLETQAQTASNQGSTIQELSSHLSVHLPGCLAVIHLSLCTPRTRTAPKNRIYLDKQIIHACMCLHTYSCIQVYVIYDVSLQGVQRFVPLTFRAGLLLNPGGCTSHSRCCKRTSATTTGKLRHHL